MDESSAEPRARRPLTYAIVLFTVALAALFLWKEIALYRQDRKHETQREADRAEQALRESRLQDQAAARVSELLELFSVPLGWTMRAEALRGNEAQIEQYMLALLEHRSVRGAALVGADGTIRVATDRKLQGAAAADVYGDLLDPAQVSLREVGDELRLMLPLLGPDRRIGSLVVSFSRDALLGARPS